MSTTDLFNLIEKIHQLNNDYLLEKDEFRDFEKLAQYSLEQEDSIVLQCLLKSNALFEPKHWDILIHHFIQANHQNKPTFAAEHLKLYEKFVNSKTPLKKSKSFNFSDEYVYNKLSTLISEQSQTTQENIIYSFFKVFPTNKYLHLVSTNFSDEIIKHNLPVFSFFYEQNVLYYQNNQDQIGNIYDFQSEVLKHAILHGNETVLHFILTQISDDNLYNEYLQDDIIDMIGFSGKEKTLDWLSLFNIDINDPITQQRIVLASLNMSGSALDILPGFYQRGGRFYHSQFNTKIQDIKQTLFEDLKGNFEDDNTKIKELNCLVNLMNQYEKHNIPILIKELLPSFPDGANLVQKIALNLKLEETLASQNKHKKHKL